MHNQPVGLDLLSAVSFLGESVLVELVWDDEPESFWRLGRVLGIVLPVEGVYEQAHLIIMNPNEQFPLEVFLSDIRTIRAIRHRDRHSSGNVLDRMTRPNLAGSGAALPARRNGSFVPSNGSTGAAHP